MKNLLQVLRSILIGLASFGLLLGGLSLSLAEGNMSVTLTPTPTSTYTSTLQPTYTPTLQSFVTRADTSTPQPPTQTPTPPPPPTNCPPPAGWLAYKVQSGDTLDKLAARYRTSSAALQQANCLLTTELLPGVFIYVPPVPTQTRIPCGPPRGWIASVIQPGDTLYRLSQAFGITVPELQIANCMGNSTLLHVGQTFYVPPWATRTPSPTFPGISTQTFVPTDTLNDSTLTFTSSPPAFAPTGTPTDTLTSTPSETPSNTPNDTPTDTQVPSPTFTDAPTP